MQLIIFLPSFFIFLYTLYKLVKDDHVFLRKNVKLEQIFDVAFIVIIISTLFSHISLSANGFSLTVFIVSGVISLFAASIYKNLPSGRTFDFFALSFLTTLPVVFLLRVFFATREEVPAYIFSAFFYAILAIIFMKILFGKMMNRTIKDGKVGTLFIVLFSLVSISVSIFNSIKMHRNLLSLENIFLVVVLIVSAIFLIRNK